jgi:cytochrome c-type biogenesis protein CcmH/NrfG
MRERKRQQRPSRDEDVALSQPSGTIRRRWRAAIGVLAVAVVVAVIVDWRMSPWSDSPPPRETVEPSASNGPASSDDFAPRPEVVVPSSQTHEGLMAEMASMAERVVATFPDDPTAYDLQGRVYAYRGKSAEASRAWEHCLRLDPRRPDACNGLAKLAIKRGDDAAAEPLLRRALEIDPTFSEVVIPLADLLTRSGRADEAVAVLERHAALIPTAADSLLLLAQTQLQLGIFDKARTNFEAVIKLRPTASEAYLGLGTVLMRQGRREESRTYLEKSRELRAQKPAAPAGMTAEVFDLTMTRVSCAGSVLYAARLYHSHGCLLEAEQLCRQAAALDPKSLPCRLFLISLYQEMERLPDAIQVCQDTVAADPRNPDLLFRLGVLNAYEGRFDAAEAALKQVIQRAPEQARGYAGLAEVYLESRRGGEEAVRLAREAVRLEPVALHYVLLGRILVQAGDLDNARSALNEAVKREPDNAVYRQLRDELQAQR